MTILCLKLAHAKILKEWRETDKKITFCYNEAKDNAKFIQALETKCHSLYLDDPVRKFDIQGFLKLSIFKLLAVIGYNMQRF